jgi:hypothetical protein
MTARRSGTILTLSAGASRVAPPGSLGYGTTCAAIESMTQRSMSMLVRRRIGLPAGALAWGSLLAGIGASLAANVAAADPTAVGRGVAAVPPVALLLAWELLMHVRAPTSPAAMCR